MDGTTYIKPYTTWIFCFRVGRTQVSEQEATSKSLSN